MDKPRLSVSFWGATDAGKTSLLGALRSSYPARLDASLLESEARFYLCYDPGATKDPDEKIFTGNDPVIRMLWELLCPTDATILVIDANAGTTPQTKAQLGLARLLGFPCPVIFLNKVEKVSDAGWLDALEQEAREALIERGFAGDDAPCVRGSALLPEDLWLGPLLTALDTFFIEPMPLEAKPLRAFCLGTPPETKKTSFVVKIQQGSVKVGDQVEVVGREPPYLAEISRIEAKHKTFSPEEAATAGMAVTFSLRARRIEEFPLGKIIATPGTLKTYVQAKVRVYALPVWYHGISRQLSSMDSVQVAFGGSPMPALLSFPSGFLRVGDYDEAVLTLPKAVLNHRYQTWSLTKEERDSCGPPLEIGSRFWLLREYRQWGFGVVTELLQEG